jgi:signal transduction histidine kinase
VATVAATDTASALSASVGSAEVELLRRQVRDMAALLALPAMWRSAEPVQVVSSLAEVVVGLLRVDVAYARCVDPAERMIVDAMRPVGFVPPAEIDAWLGVAGGAPLIVAPLPANGGDIRLASVCPGRTAQEWCIVAGASREDFPTPQERFLLQVAADQAALSVEKALLIAAERRARTAAEEANRAKSDFLAVMSHELRTPLNAIDGYAELMELGIRGPLTEHQRQDLERIRKSQRHLLGLINDILNLARIETGRLEYRLVDVRLADVLADLQPMIEPQIAAKRLRFDLRLPDDALSVHADAEKLEQILLNLLSNAVKFTDAGGLVGLSCAAEGEHVRVTVTDTGRGIAPEHLARVFEPFVQIDASRTRTHEGVGLGLAISRDLARGMGGDLTAESTPGQGSAFVVTLPRA